MQVFLLIVTIITCVIFLLVNLYITVIYKHRQESIFNPKNIFCLILIMIMLLQIEFQPLFMLVDILNSRTSTTDLTMFWVVLYFSILGNLAFVKPLATSIYQSDDDDPMWKRILWIIIQVIITAGVFAMFLGIGWLFFGYLHIDLVAFAHDIDSPSIDSIIGLNQPIPSQKISNQLVIATNFEIRLTIPCFLLGLLCLLGYPILICCGSCGLTALPVSLIMQFKNRPKYRRSADARKIVDTLKQQTVTLITASDQLKRAITRIQFVDGWWARRTKKAQLQNSLKQIQARFQFHKDYYDLFHLQLKMENVNPLVFVGKLILGMFCIFISVILWVQILLAQLIYTKDKASGSTFLDRMLIFFEQQNANFMSIALVMLINIFLSVATIKGTMFFSNNVPFITVHPMVQGKTWLNSFLFQLSLIVLSSASLVNLMLGSFPYYLRGGEIALMMGQILNGMTFVKFFISNKIFIYGYLIMAVIGGVFVLAKLVCCTQGKTQILMQIQQKRKKLFGKDNKDRPLQMIQMTEMHLNQKQNEIKHVKQKKKQREKQKKNKIKLVNS